MKYYFLESDRDMVDWSGKKPLDYRKIRTTVSASTYSSEYYNSDNFDNSTTTNLVGLGTSTLPLPRRSNERSTLRKFKNHKRFATTTGVLHRTQSFLNFPKSPISSGDNFNSPPTSSETGGHILNMGGVQEPNRSTYFSPELNKGKRHERKYQSFLFKKKTKQFDTESMA